MNGTDWIKTEVRFAYQVVLLYFSLPEIKFLRGSFKRLRDKLCFPKTKHLVKPDLLTATLKIHKYFVDSVPAVEKAELMLYFDCHLPACTVWWDAFTPHFSICEQNPSFIASVLNLGLMFRIFKCVAKALEQLIAWHTCKGWNSDRVSTQSVFSCLSCRDCNSKCPNHDGQVPTVIVLIISPYCKVLFPWLESQISSEKKSKPHEIWVTAGCREMNDSWT